MTRFMDVGDGVYLDTERRKYYRLNTVEGRLAVEIRSETGSVWEPLQTIAEVTE